MRTLIVDDEPLARRRLLVLLAEEPGIEVVGEADNGANAVRAIAEHRPDLVLLDIQMPGKDGFEVLAEIAGVHEPMVIFVTAHDEHAIRAFEVEALDYVLKPVLQHRLHVAVQRAMTRRQDNPEMTATIARLLERVRPPAEPDRIAIRGDSGVRFLAVADIDWVSANGDDVEIHAGRELHRMRSTMTEIANRLGTARFVRVHRSIVVNRGRIREIQSWFKGDYVIVLADGTKLRSGRTYRAAVQALISRS